MFAQKVCDIVYSDSNVKTKNPYGINVVAQYSGDKKTTEEPIVYLIKSDDVIMKIGHTQTKGGLPGAVNFYLNAGNGSDHSGQVRFVVNCLIREELNEGKSVEVWAIYQPDGFQCVKVHGLFDVGEVPGAPHAKHIEKLCLDQFVDKYGHLPPWNFQESDENSYPPYLKEMYNDYKKNLGY
jgi:hypothetical protein